MTATNHVVTGALIATYIHNPWLAIPVAVGAHFAMDALPHFDPPTEREIYDLKYFMWLAADCGLAASVLATLFFLQPPMVWLLISCGIACASPDLMWIYYQLTIKVKQKGSWPWIARFHAKIQKHTSWRFWPIELSWLVVMGGLLATRLY